MSWRLFVTMFAGTLLAQSPWNGSFTAAQAERGERLYRESCLKCHGENLAGGEGAPPLAGTAFQERWSTRTLAALAEKTRATMPPDGPGLLREGQAVDLSAYLLRFNGAAVGTRSEPAPLPASGPRGEWRYYGGDAGTKKYSPLDQINATNVRNLRIAWRWSANNFGKQPEVNWQVTPLMVNGILYVTAGARRDAVAIDAVTGETLWMYRLDEGERGANVARPQNRGLAYWGNGSDARLLLISPGYQLIALDARTGRPIPSFGSDGRVDLIEGLDREKVPPGQIGSSSPAIVIRDTIIVGAALQAGTAPASKTNVPGFIRGYDVRTGRKLWTFRTIPRPGEFGNDTWQQNSWEYTGNAGAWAPLSGDEEFGYVYIPVENATGDFYGGHRPGNNLFSSSLVCLDARTGKRIWHYQLVHHDLWDMDVTAAPILADIRVRGRSIRAVAVVTKQAFTYVFDRLTGEPVWPIVERPVPQSQVPGERTSPTQPFPTLPKPFDRQGLADEDLLDFTPAIKQEARRIAAGFQMGPLFAPPIVAGANGKKATLTMPSHLGGANWQGGAFDPETNILYVSSVTNPATLAVAPGDPKQTDMAYTGSGIAYSLGGFGGSGDAPADATRSTVWQVPDGHMGPFGLPLVNPPWGRITAIDLNTGEHVWMRPNGAAPEYVRNHPALKGFTLPQTGRPSRSPLLVTRTLLFGADGANLFNPLTGGGGNTFRAIDKRTGDVLHEMQLPGMATGAPMTYMADGRQFVVVAVGSVGAGSELVALALP
ncbi:MAG TPA: PQQ-binding-like beta-propeller repeat protein [Bryobacteraceae bacterium]|nr:PQQ-binding-like beta-propeller repeat protein [Bryobacteraceae bacterium]